MSFYEAKSKVQKVTDGRRVTLQTGDSFETGVHGAVKAHYKLDVRDLPLPVDYIAGATGA